MGLNAVLVTILYILGITLLVILIIVSLKLIGIIDKTNYILDDVNNKIKTLDGVFNMINSATLAITSLENKIISKFTSIFRGKNKKKKKYKEEDFYE